MAQRTLTVGERVIAVDEHGVDHDALITCIHGGDPIQYHRGEDGTISHNVSVEWEGRAPCVNLLFVSGDRNKQDSYGRQIERRSSFVHKGDQTAGGMYWRFPDEEPLPMVEAHS